MRQDILERDGHQCQHPGCTEYREAYLDAHHIVYRSHGGQDVISNGVTLCWLHHTGGNESPHRSRAWRRYWEQWAVARYSPRYYLAEQHRAEGHGTVEG